MLRISTTFAKALVLAVLAQSRAAAQQDWSPPSRQMPAMPETTVLNGDWRTSLRAWFAGVALENVQAVGEGTRGAERFRFVRFTEGIMPTAAWMDRNGDGRADRLEIYRNGSIGFQLIDADYDGNANVLRV